MARYIDADKLIENIVKIKDLRTLSTKTIGEAISNTPTADVVEVVRCGYCANSVPNGLFSVECKKFKCCMCKSNFCSFGEKRCD